MKSNRAFTLIELLIVVAVVAILVGLLIPGVSLLKERGRRIGCLNNERNLGVALVLCARDNNGMTPDNRANSSNGNYSWCSALWDSSTKFTEYYDPNNTGPRGALVPYLDRWQAIQCPTSMNSDKNGCKLFCPRGVAKTLSYSMSQFGPNNGSVFTFKLASMANLGLQFAFVEENAINGAYNTLSLTTRQGDWNDFPATWHTFGINIAYADGHAAWYQFQDVQTRNLFYGNGMSKVQGATKTDCQWFRVGNMAKDL